MSRCKTAFAFVLALSAVSAPAFAQTATAFNLTCAPKSHSIQGVNTFGAPLTFEDYQGVIEETVELAVDLTAKTACNPRYCTPEQWRTADPILSISEKEIVFDDIAAREVESNEYNVMSYHSVYRPATRTLITTFGFFDEGGKSRTGYIELVKACTKAAFALSKE